LTFQEICHQRSCTNTESAVANKRAKKQFTGASSDTVTLFGLIYVEYGFSNLVFVADQLGHSLQMLIKRYAKWIHGDKNRIEMAKLNTTNGT
jgi:phage protein U